jgi:hypothetical protein
MSALRAEKEEEEEEEEVEEEEETAGGGESAAPTPSKADHPTPSPALKSTRGAHTIDKGEIPPAATAALLESPKETPPNSHTKTAATVKHHNTLSHHQNSIYNSTGKFTKGITPSKTEKKTTGRKKMAPHTAPTQPRVTVPIGPLDETCKQEAMGLLKLKVSFMMQLVEKNMDVLRSLEGQENDENEDEKENGTALDENTVNQMIDLSGEEVKLCRNFEDRLNTMIVKQHSAKAGLEIERSPSLEEQFASV